VVELKSLPIILAVVSCATVLGALVVAFVTGSTVYALMITALGIVIMAASIALAFLEGVGKVSRPTISITWKRKSQKAGKGEGQGGKGKSRKKEKALTTPLSEYPLVAYISRLTEGMMKDEIPRAMVYLHPATYSRFYAAIFLLVLTAALPSGVVLLVLLRNPLAFILVFSPLILLVLPMLEVKIKISNRKSDVGNELPFFLVYAASLQVAGLSLYASLDRLTEWMILPKIKREALVVKRDYLYFSHNPLLALENVAGSHPDENFKTIVLGYTSVLRSGGDLIVYLNSKVSDGLRSIVDKWKKYADSAGTLGEMSLAIFLMFPSLLIAMAIAFASNYSLVLMQVYAYAVLPLLGTVLILGIHVSQPRFYDSYNINRVVLIVSGAAAAFGLVTWFVLADKVVWLTSTLLIFCVMISAEYIKEHGEVAKVEKALPLFLRDLTEMMKIGYDINQTLIKLPKQRKYNKTFDLFLKRVSEHLEMNLPLKRVSEMMTVRSWLCRYVFFILSEIVDTGGGTPEVLESLTGFVNGVVIEKNKAKNTTRSYTFLGYATPAFLSAIMVFMVNMLLPSSNMLTGVPANVSILPSASTLALISGTSLLVVVLTAFVVGILIAKIVDMSVYATHHAAIALAISLASFLLIK